MRGIFFEDRTGRVARSPYRTDVALFVGHVDRRRRCHERGGAPDDRTILYPVLPRGGAHRDRHEGLPWLRRWLHAEGWVRADRPVNEAAELDELLDLPVPIDRFETFSQLFAWDHRPVGEGARERVADTYLGAAVRAFFAQGGRLCYVARVGDVWPVPTTPAQSRALARERVARVEALIPGALHNVGASPVERATWRGVWALYGLPDVSLVCVPELPDVMRTHFDEEVALPPSPARPVAFLECSEGATSPPESWLRHLHAPACDADGYLDWARALSYLTFELASPRAASALREVQLIAAVPRPHPRLALTDLRKYLDELVGWNRLPAGLSVPVESGGLSSAFLQLVYPWLRTESSRRLPGGIEPPDAALAGAIARVALDRGCYWSAAGQPMRGVLGYDPELTSRDIGNPEDLDALGGRVSLVGPRPTGAEVLSDVTTSLEPTFRLAHANRALSAIVRVLRTLGEEQTFAPSNEATWSMLRSRVRDVLREFWVEGALRGASEAEAFSVRCDRSTMSQDDLDAGRLIVVVEIALAVSIQRIQVVLTRTGDTVKLERAA